MNVDTETAPPATHHKAPMGLRGVAAYEFGKGVLFLAIALGALSLVHKDVGDEAQNIVKRLHLDPAWHYSKLFIEASAKFTDTRLRLFALIAGVFALIRIVAAVGLWRERPWAEWFAVLSAGLYVPVEIIHLCQRPSLILAGVLAGNMAIVVYLSRLLLARARLRRAAAGIPRP